MRYAGGGRGKRGLRYVIPYVSSYFARMTFADYELFNIVILDYSYEYKIILVVSIFPFTFYPHVRAYNVSET